MPISARTRSLLTWLPATVGAIGTAGMIAALTIGGTGVVASGAVLAGTSAAFILGAVFAAIAVAVALTVRSTRQPT